MPYPVLSGDSSASARAAVRKLFPVLGTSRRARVCLYASLWVIGLSTLAAPRASASGPTVGPATPVAPVSRVALAHNSGSDTLELVGLEQQFRNIAGRVAPSVVAITASSDVVPADAPARSADLTGAALDRLLSGRGRTVGTGFCIDPAGFIVTNEHVVAGAKSVWVTTDAGVVYPALVVGTDPRSDLAVLKIPGSLPAVPFAPSGSAYRGQWTVALGNPVGLSGRGEMCMSVGVVSATRRSLPRLSAKEGRLYSDLIQTTAEVNPGNSGGPLFDLQGRVLGVITAVVLPQKSTNGLGFAMPLDDGTLAKINRLKAGEEVAHGFMGVAVEQIPPQRDGVAPGVRVTSVFKGEAADGLLQAGDVILRVDGRPVWDEETFVRLVSLATVGAPTAVVVDRTGREVAFNVEMRARPAATATVWRETQRMFWRGLELAAGDASGGVRVLGVQPDSPLADLGIRPGSVIRRVGGREVRDLVTLQQILNDTPAELCQVTLYPQDGVAVTANALD